MNILPSHIIKKINNVNESYYNDCIDEFLKIFNIDSKHFNEILYDTFIDLFNYESQFYECNKYIDYSNSKQKTIFINYPTYDENLNYKKIFFKIKPYKDNYYNKIWI